MGSEVVPDVSIREARADDRYLLCTDGLSDVVSAPTIPETLTDRDTQETADRLVELALRGGGPDNVTWSSPMSSRRGTATIFRSSEARSPLHQCAGQRRRQPSGTSGADDPAGHRAATPSRPHPPAAVEADRHHPGRARCACRRGRGVLRLDPDPYFVGKDGSEVAIFRGVNAQFGPIKFFEVQENTDLKLADLTAAARSQVVSGITAANLTRAQSIKSNLLDQLLPPCRTDSPSPSPTASAPATAGGKSTPACWPTALPTPTPSPSVTPVPGVDCRKV